MIEGPDLILICCEGNTEVAYFSILKRRFRLPAYIKIIPDPNEDYHRLGQHKHLIDMAKDRKDKYAEEFKMQPENIEVWAVCDRDDYKGSFTDLQKYADNNGINLAFSDPQFENYLLQHFSLNKSSNKKSTLEMELSQHILETKPLYAPYRKGDLCWLDEMIDEKHALVGIAIRNANTFSNHTRQPFFTVQRLTKRLVDLS